MGGQVRSLFLLAALLPKDNSLTNYARIVRWTRPDARPGHRVRIVVSYTRTREEQELYVQLRDFLDTQVDDALLRDAIDRAWRSSVSALERVLVRFRSELEITHATPRARSQLALFDPLVLGEQLEIGTTGDQRKAWRDPSTAATQLMELLQGISSLTVDSKLESAVSELVHRRGDRSSTPCILTAMRETALYVSEALEARQHPVTTAAWCWGIGRYSGT